MRRRSVGVIAASLLMTSGLWAQVPHLDKTIALQDAVVSSTAVSHTGDLVGAICRDEKLRVWDARSGNLSHTLDLGGQQLTVVRFSADDRLLGLGGSAGLVRIWELPTATLKLEFTTPRDVFALAFSPDAKLVAVAPLESAVEVWDLASDKKLSELKAPFSGTSALAFSPDDDWLATADGDTNIRVYNARTGARKSITESLLLEPFAITYSTDGKYIFAGGGDKTISVVNASNGQVLRSFSKQHYVLGDLRLSKDGKFLAAVYFSEDDSHESVTGLDLGHCNAIAANAFIRFRE